MGTDVPFTASYKGKFDAAAQGAMEEAPGGSASADDSVIDAEVVQAE